MKNIVSIDPFINRLEDVMVEHSLGPNGCINFLMPVGLCRSFHVESCYMLDVILY